ncbi:hypothetical protein WMZ97_12520 [Lentibacillus sp. N15]|uniref:beta family protein n=1 Tax=Lentibacillus songyuanensis TaxID=3136161 RepID=UPI0031B9BFC1
MTELKYYPILKWKMGEKIALERLSKNVINKIAPIIEVVESEKKIDILREIRQINGFDKIFLDTSYVEDDNSGYLENLMIEAGSKGLPIYPVLSYDEFKYRADNFIKSDELLVKIAIPEDLDGDDYNTMFDSIKKWINKCDVNLSVLLDLGLIENRMDANRQYAELKRVLDKYIMELNINNIIISVTSFPDDLSDISSGGENFYKRFDIKIFTRLMESKEFHALNEKICYSDYGVTKFTESEIDFSRLRYGILPKARYTTKDDYWILKGKRDNYTKEWIMNHQTLAQTIFSSSYYYGENFSFGDYDIMERALGHKKDSPEKTVGPGSNTNWVTIAVSHHIPVVVDELSMLFDS